jgi:hypothetical protein
MVVVFTGVETEVKDGRGSGVGGGGIYSRRSEEVEMSTDDRGEVDCITEWRGVCGAIVRLVSCVRILDWCGLFVMPLLVRLGGMCANCCICNRTCVRTGETAVSRDWSGNGL